MEGEREEGERQINKMEGEREEGERGGKEETENWRKSVRKEKGKRRDEGNREGNERNAEIKCEWKT